MRHQRTVFSLLVSVVLFMPLTGLTQYSATELVSTDSEGRQGNSDSFFSNVASSDDGRYIVFESLADNFTSPDSLGFADVFLKDLETGVLIRASNSSSAGQAQGNSYEASVSSDGNRVLFTSDAPNIVSGDTNDTSDVFLRDVATESTTRVSLRDGGDAQIIGPSHSARMNEDGRYIVFVSSAPSVVAGIAGGINHVYLRDNLTNTTTLLSQSDSDVAGNRNSARPVISADGRFVVFESRANLVGGFLDDELSNIYLRDRTLDTIERISRGSAGGVSNDDSFKADLSDDGRYVVFESVGSNLIANDNNQVSDIFLWDRNSISPNKTIRISRRGADEANGASDSGRISANGEFVVFRSDATNLVVNDESTVSDIFAYSIALDEVQKVSRRPEGQVLNAGSTQPSINANGQYLTFTSQSSNLLPNDSNESLDIFRVDLQCLLEPATGTPNDTDEDATDDCQDGCPTDPLKISPGICGCGIADTDSDNDGSENCIDECPANPEKIAAGSCGCDLDESDDNNNGFPDCLDPNPDSNLLEIIVEPKRRGRAVVYISTQFPGARYQVILRQNRKIIRRFVTRERLRVRRLTPGQRYVVSYSAFLPEGGFTPESRRVAFRARGPR
jgi:hypothetical protein